MTNISYHRNLLVLTMINLLIKQCYNCFSVYMVCFVFYILLIVTYLLCYSSYKLSFSFYYQPLHKNLKVLHWWLLPKLLNKCLTENYQISNYKQFLNLFVWHEGLQLAIIFITDLLDDLFFRLMINQMGGKTFSTFFCSIYK